MDSTRWLVELERGLRSPDVDHTFECLLNLIPFLLAIPTKDASTSVQTAHAITVNNVYLRLADIFREKNSRLRQVIVYVWSRTKEVQPSVMNRDEVIRRVYHVLQSNDREGRYWSFKALAVLARLMRAERLDVIHGVLSTLDQDDYKERETAMETITEWLTNSSHSLEDDSKLMMLKQRSHQGILSQGFPSIQHIVGGWLVEKTKQLIWLSSDNSSLLSFVSLWLEWIKELALSSEHAQALLTHLVQFNTSSMETIGCVLIKTRILLLLRYGFSTELFVKEMLNLLNDQGPISLKRWASWGIAQAARHQPSHFRQEQIRPIFVILTQTNSPSVLFNLLRTMRIMAKEPIIFEWLEDTEWKQWMDFALVLLIHGYFPMKIVALDWSISLLSSWTHFFKMTLTDDVNQRGHILAKHGFELLISATTGGFSNKISRLAKICICLIRLQIICPSIRNEIVLWSIDALMRMETNIFTKRISRAITHLVLTIAIYDNQLVQRLSLPLFDFLNRPLSKFTSMDNFDIWLNVLSLVLSMCPPATLYLFKACNEADNDPSLFRGRLYSFVYTLTSIIDAFIQNRQSWELYRMARSFFFNEYYMLSSPLLGHLRHQVNHNSSKHWLSTLYYVSQSEMICFQSSIPISVDSKDPFCSLIHRLSYSVQNFSSALDHLKTLQCLGVQCEPHIHHLSVRYEIFLAIRHLFFCFQEILTQDNMTSHLDQLIDLHHWIGIKMKSLLTNVSDTTNESYACQILERCYIFIGYTLHKILMGLCTDAKMNIQKMLDSDVYVNSEHYIWLFPTILAPNTVHYQCTCSVSAEYYSSSPISIFHYHNNSCVLSTLLVHVKDSLKALVVSNVLPMFIHFLTSLLYIPLPLPSWFFILHRTIY